ncbi:hypothetical protein RD792_000688 [Penstemon davidsonii]|uniref:Protein NRT1/ PTR FAMILY 5.10-like n=1 Tax=Penstemon davidsonii TaxID=160366 RepID=A0ABR0DLP3_9LAMI|nr:hypothetical protein RD792_000688 [Penstemon davidsonii]
MEYSRSNLMNYLTGQLGQSTATAAVNVNVWSGAAMLLPLASWRFRRRLIFGKICSIGDIDDAKAILRLVTVWSTCLVFAIVFPQSSTLFIKQGRINSSKILSSFLSSFLIISIITSGRGKKCTAATGEVISDAAKAPLLDDLLLRAYVDYKCRPSARPKSGCWKSASFIIGIEFAERFAYYGISSNLLSYLTNQLGQSTAVAAANVNRWSGMAWLLPLLGAFVADSFLGRYWTIIVASLLYILGLGFLSLSAALHSVVSSARKSTTCPPQFEVIFFFFSLYIVALAQGGNKPCAQAFGADQFDDEHHIESKAKSSFFNWWNFLLTASLLLGTTTYRFPIKRDGRINPFLRISRVFVKAARNWKATPIAISIQVDGEDQTILPREGSQFKFLDKALLASDEEEGKICRTDVEVAKAILRLIPIWCTCLGFTIVYSQLSTLFLKQASTMDRITTKPLGISMLQRIGTGLVLSLVTMIIAALVERERLAVAKEYGLIDMPKATVPMSVWWMAPQYIVFGIAEVFTLVGLQEFFYDQVPCELGSIGLALYLSIFGIGNFISSFLVSFIEKSTRGHGQEGWFSDNLNRAHLDYFYLVLAGISLFSTAAYVYFAKNYVYSRRIIF